MGYYHESACNGCAECIGCGRQFKSLKIKYCDKCKEEVDELFYDESGREICWECYKEQFEQRVCEDDDITECSNCGNTEDILYRVEGEWICEACMMDLAEKVEE